MRTFFISLAASCSLGFTACSGTDDGFVPPQVGTQFGWKYTYDGNVDDDVATVVATGPDFAIFRQSLEVSHYVEFSGIGYSNCDDEEQPARKDRQAALSAWPLEVGQQIAWQNDTITVERQSAYDLPPEGEPVFWLKHDYADADSGDDNFAISTRYRTALDLKWPDNARDHVVFVKVSPIKSKEVQPGYFLMEGVDIGELGECAALLSEAEPVAASAAN